MRVIIDGSYSKDKAELHEHLRKTLHFPDYYGANLDALYDLLCEYSDTLEILFIHGEALEENLGEYAAALIKTFREAAAENERIRISFSEEEA